MEGLTSSLDSKIWQELISYISQTSKGSQRNFSLALSDWMEHLGSDASEVGSSLIFANATSKNAIEFIQELERKRLASGTIRGIINKVKRSYKVLMDSGILKKTPFAIVRNVKVQDTPNRKKILEFEDVMPLILSPDESTLLGLRDRALLSILFGGALRPIEVCKLKRQDFKKENQIYYLYLEKTKNGKDYDQVIPSWAGIFIDQYLKELEKKNKYENLFVSIQNQNTKIYNTITTKTVREIFKKYAKLLGYEDGYSAYSARATTITKLVVDLKSMDKKNLKDIQEFSRHGSLDMLQVYYRFITSKQDSIAHQLNY